MTAFHRTAAWGALVRRMRPVLQAQVDAGTAVCLDCGRPVLPGDRWQVGHRLGRDSHPHLALMDWNVGTSHGGQKGRSCNQRAGARYGNAKRAARAKRSTEMLPW
ncbi:hypothetical protein GCM10009846_10330 [Agrococcus versicolor]|uniref:HNH endonuclease n=1 Tax=Agrococcus versicolor TaxID=501482 RepID=A0ABP5MGW2_9MICO